MIAARPPTVPISLVLWGEPIMLRYLAILTTILLATAPAAAQRPNFVIFMTDDQRADAMSCADNKILKTPNMDRIAKEGMRFRNAFVTNSLCAPSRATVLTGQYSHSHGVIDNKNRQISPDSPFFPDLLRRSGYQVVFCGKSHVSGSLRDRSWDYYFGFQGQGNYLKPMVAEGTKNKDQPYQGWMDDVVTDKAVQWLDKNKESKQPFCLILWFKAPHRSWNPPPRHAQLFQDAVIPRPDTYEIGLKGDPKKPKAFNEADNKVGNAKDVPGLDWIKDYYRCLTGVDDNVGKVLDALKKNGQLDSTFVLYTSDNGFFHGEWGRYDKRLMHEPSIRVPMLVRYPKLVRPGSICDKMVLNIDIAPTILELAGVELPKSMHGRSMVPLLQNPQAVWRTDWLYEYFEFPGPHSVRPNRGIRTERYKLIHYFTDPEEFELYDLEKDPGERENLYTRPEYAELTRQLMTRLQELRRETGDLKQ
jgi:arylsulfatase A-like enzyme